MSPRSRDDSKRERADKRQLAATQALLDLVAPDDVGQEVASILAVQRQRQETSKTHTVSGDVEQEYVALGSIHPSPWQPRQLRSDADVEQLAAALCAEGLVHPPTVRPRPGATGEWELVGGHVRLDALRRLAERGDDARGTLVRRVIQGVETVFVPVTIRRELSDGDARRAVLAENLARTDLAQLDAARAILALRDAEKAENRSGDVRSLADILGRDRTTVSQYLQVAQSITTEVLRAAGLVSDDDVTLSPRAADALARLTLRELYGIAKDAGGVEARAAALRAVTRLHTDPDVAAKGRAGRMQTERSFVRSAAMLRLPAFQAADTLLTQVIPAIGILRERVASDRDGDHSARLTVAAKELEDEARKLRAIAQIKEHNGAE